MNWKPYPMAVLVCAALLAAPLLRAAPPTLPAPVTQAQTLMSQGDSSGALRVLNDYLKTAPQDANARFTRGLALARLGRDDDAIKAFAALTKDYPQLPEPYNNLAVLYAKKGQYDKAREALKAALATHPSYATASENLGDVYAAMAAEAYNHALKIDKNNQQIRYKLSLINRLNAGTATVATTAGKGGASSGASTLSSQGGTEEQTATAALPVAPKPAVAAAAPTAPAAAASSGHQRSDAVAMAVASWAAAWSRQDVSGYLAHYAADFADEGMTHQAWEAQRRERLSAPKHISVEVSDLQVSMQGPKQARASFNQHYVSNTYHDRVHKVLELRNIGGQWKIVKETEQ